MKKIMILGSAGSGKSTLAKKISNKTGIQVIHMDTLFWKKNWIPVSKEELKIKVEDIIKNDTWIIDGNYSSCIDIRYEKADTIIYLDKPLWLCLYRVIKRRIVYSNKTRPDLTSGCEEKIDLKFIKWIIKFHLVRNKAYKNKLETFADKNIHIIKNKKDEEEFLHSI